MTPNYINTVKNWEAQPISSQQVVFAQKPRKNGFSVAEAQYR